MSSQTATAQYKIVFVGFRPGADTDGYNCFDYLTSDVLGASYPTAEAAQAALDAAYKGADADGVDAIFEVVEAED